jgi:hypothetical protein
MQWPDGRGTSKVQQVIHKDSRANSKLAKAKEQETTSKITPMLVKLCHFQGWQ